MHLPNRRSPSAHQAELILLSLTSLTTLLPHRHETGLLPLSLFALTLLLALHKGPNLTKARTARLRRCADPLGLACGALLPLALVPALPDRATSFALCACVTTLLCVFKGGVGKWTARTGVLCCLVVATCCVDAAGRAFKDVVVILLCACIPLVQWGLVYGCWKCFTVCESVLVACAMCGVVCMALMEVLGYGYGAGCRTSEVRAVYGISVSGLVGCVLGGVIGVGDALRCREGGMSRRVAVVLIGVVLPTYVFAWVFGVGCEPFGWVFWYVLASWKRLLAMGVWIFVGGGSVWYGMKHSSWGVSDVLARKVYHVAGVVIFGGGILLDEGLMAVAGCVGLGLLVLMEMGRICGVGRVERFVHEIGGKLVDEKDRGVVKVTHLYLLVGCAFGVWVRVLGGGSGAGKGFAGGGLVATGVLDGVAAAVGRRWGRRRWRGGGGRSVEGSIAGMMAGIMFGRVWGWATGDWVGWRCTWVACGLTAGVEAATAQIDNAVLPLVYCALVAGCAERPSS